MKKTTKLTKTKKAVRKVAKGLLVGKPRKFKFKVGDKVRILSTWDRTCKISPHLHTHDAIDTTDKSLLGKDLIVREITPLGGYHIEEENALTTDLQAFSYCECELEAVVPEEKEASSAMAILKPSGDDKFVFGSIELDIIDDKTDPLVPKDSLDIFLPINDKTALALGVKENLPVLLIGETGTGKTSVVKQLAHLRRQPYVRVNMTGYTTPDELIGSKSVRATPAGNETYYEHGIITNAMQRGAILVIDEINATTPDCLFILHGLLDEDRRITLPNGDVIYPHKNFRVFATCNPDYEGTKSMNKAFLDRFPIIISVDTLAPDEEKNLIIKRTGVSEDLANILVTVATMARKDYLEQKIYMYVSTRSLLNTAKLIHSGMTPRDAWTATIVKKTSNKDEQRALLDFFLSVTRQAEGASHENKPIITTQKVLDELKKKGELAEGRVLDYEKKLKDQIATNEKLVKDVTILLTQSNTIQGEIEKQQALILEEQKKNQALEDKIQDYEKIKSILTEASRKIDGDK